MPISYVKIALLIAIIALFSCQPDQTQHNEEEPIASLGSWEEIISADNSTPVARHEAAFIGLGDKFYLLGGRGEKVTSIYNTKTNTWSEGAKPPLEMHHMQPVIWDNKIYILGAMTGPYPGETPIPNIVIYDPATDTWSNGPEIPEGRRRGGAGVAVYNGKIYLACGIKDGHRGDHKNWLDVFDPATETWETLPDAPRARDHFQAIAANDKLYMLGGRRTAAADNPFKNTETEVDVYDFKTSSWSTLENGLPTERAGNYAALVGNEIIVFGGESFFQEPAHTEVEALNVETNEWTTLAPMIQGRHGTGAILYDGKIYVASGSLNRGGGPELTTMEAFSR